MKKLNKKGFTLAELLIVVAIIAVLVAIAIPVFNSQLEKAREATDAANLRAAYAECSAAVLDNSNATGASKAVVINQVTAGWTDTTVKIANVPVTDSVLAAAVKGDTIYVNVAADGTLSFTKTTASFTVLS